MSISFYRDPVIVHPQRHRRHRIAPLADYRFVQHTHAVYAAAVEFGDAGREFPIVFARIGGQICPVLMMGLQEGENLFVRPDGTWAGHYLPAFVRRYPFVLAEVQGLSAETQLGVCVDAAYTGWNTMHGEPLFDEQGQQTEYLRKVVAFLTRYQQEYSRTTQFCQRIDALGLLDTMDAQIRLHDGRAFHVSGLMIVQEEKLASLADAQVLALFRAGDLGLIHQHLSSLSNMQMLAGRIPRSG